jgi:RNA polymerase sigma-70 factor (ECF subfamily)
MGISDQLDQERQAREEKLEELLADIRSGKPDAFDRFLALIQSTVFLFGVKVCGRTADASDTMQDTLLAAFQSLPQTDIRDVSALKVWLYKVAKNACLMMRRKSKFEPKTNLSLEELLPESIHQMDPSVADWSNLPLDLLLRNEAAETLREAIQKLPTPYRLVLVLRDMEQLSTKEVAAVLDISEETVKIRLHRGRLFLRKELEASFTGK